MGVVWESDILTLQGFPLLGTSICVSAIVVTIEREIVVAPISSTAMSTAQVVKANADVQDHVSMSVYL